MAKIVQEMKVNTNVKIERGTLIKDISTHFVYIVADFGIGHDLINIETGVSYWNTECSLQDLQNKIEDDDVLAILPKGSKITLEQQQCQ